MANHTHNRYLETQVLSAEPIQLVNMLYRGALENMAAARRHLAAGAIKERSARIMKAWDILRELARSLDHRQAPELSARLAELYAHMQKRLMDANTQQADAPLAEVEALLSTLGEAWRGVQAAQPSARESGYEPLSYAV
jgi:flagellar protein FliS